VEERCDPVGGDTKVAHLVRNTGTDEGSLAGEKDLSGLPVKLIEQP
jgi:hypothetical protein